MKHCNAVPLKFELQDIEILMVTPVEGRGSLQAFSSIRLGPFVINDCRIIKEPGKKPWFSLPVLSYKTQYGTTLYKTLVQVLDEGLKNQISEAVLSVWENKTGESNGECKK